MQKIHLAHVGVDESAKLEINNHQTTQPPVEKQQVHAKPFVADSQPLLPSDEGKLVAEFEQEGFKMANERIFQITFGVLVFQVEKFEHQRITNLGSSSLSMAGRA